MKRDSSSSPKEIKGYSASIDSSHSLILFNDDYNLYDYVVESLIDICKHNPLQAEQCTLIAHHKGKCDVKSGAFDVLKPMKDELLRRGLSATIATDK